MRYVIKVCGGGEVDSIEVGDEELNEKFIKASMEGKCMNYPDRYTQEKLLAMHKAKMHLELAMGLLSQ